MKPIATCLILLTLASGCSDSASNTTTENKGTSADTTQAPKISETPIPADIDKQFNKIMDEFEHKISNGFWTDFTSTTRRGGKGTTEKTFDQNAYEKFMAQKGFELIPNTDMGYKGTVKSVNVSILNKSVSGEKGGWIQQWTIEVETTTEAGTFKKKREFSSSPS
jgi:hypothetical protein